MPTDPEYLFNLGLAHFEGDRLTQSTTKAFFYWNMAATHNHAAAQYNLGTMYWHGEGVVKDLSKAAELFLKAATQGDVDAQFGLGLMTEYGQGVVQDLSKATEWYEKAAIQEHADAQYRVGFMYFLGKGVDNDLSKAAYWIEKAAKQGHIASQVSFGSMYNEGKGVTQDLSKGAYWYEMAANQGHADAQFYLGLMHYNGEGVVKDFNKAVEWFKMAADQAHDRAHFFLGVMFDNGEGVARDPVRSTHWFQQAVDGNKNNNSLDLAKYFLTGNFVGQNFFKAAYWLLRSGLSDDKKTIKISLAGFSELIALIPSALLENKEFEKVSSLEFLKIPAEARGTLGPIFAELMQSNPNLTSVTSPNYVIDEDEARLIKKSLDINTELTEVDFKYTQLDTPKISFEKVSKVFWSSLPTFLNFEKPIKDQILDTVKLNKNIFELRQHLKIRREEIENRPLPFFDAIPWGVLMEIGNQIIIRSLKSGCSKEATLIALDEFLLSVHADGIRQIKTITNS